MADIDISDLTTVAIGRTATIRGYFSRLFGALINADENVTFNELLISKPTARKIYMRAYPKAKV